MEFPRIGRILPINPSGTRTRPRTSPFASSLVGGYIYQFGSFSAIGVDRDFFVTPEIRRFLLWCVSQQLCQPIISLLPRELLFFSTSKVQFLRAHLSCRLPLDQSRTRASDEVRSDRPLKKIRLHPHLLPEEHQIMASSIENLMPPS